MRRLTRHLNIEPTRTFHLPTQEKEIPPLVPLLGQQRGQVVLASDSQSVSPEVRVPLWPLAGFVLGRPKFKS